LGRCRAKEMLRNVEIETWSGDGSADVCNVNGRTDAKHFVKITSYKTFPVTVNCKGSISSDPLMTSFHCPEDPAVSPTEWRASSVVKPMIGQQDPNSCEFSHVSLLSGDVSGNDSVNTDVHLAWAKRDSGSSSLGFSIST
jgi:hypothetical protein